jgi:hypothetical protein
MSLLNSVKKVGKQYGGYAGGVMAGNAQGAYNYFNQPSGGGANTAAARRMRASQYNTEQIGLEHQQEAERQRREAALADFDRAYANPERMAGMEKLYQTQLGDQLTGLQSAYHRNSQQAGLAAARRGRLGSSYDAEQQARLQSGLQQDVMGAEQSSYGQLQSLKLADEQQRLALRRAILSGDPEAAALAQNQAGQYNLQANQITTNAAGAEEARRRHEAEQQQMYGLLGGSLSQIGQGVNNYQTYKYG